MEGPGARNTARRKAESPLRFALRLGGLVLLTLGLLVFFAPTQASAAVGDNVIDPGEQCDDGNTTDGDGCNAAGQNEPDTTAPATPATPTGPIFAETNDPASFSFDDTTGGDVDHFVCTFDVAGAPTPAETDPCTSPATYPSLANGDYVFTVRAVDYAGNESAKAATGIRVRSAPPAGSGFTFNGPADNSVQSGPMTGFSGTIDTSLGDITTGWLPRYFWSYLTLIQRVSPDSSTAFQAGFQEFITTLCFCDNVDWNDSTPGFFPTYFVTKGGSLPSADGQYRITASQNAKPSSGAPDLLIVRNFTIDSTAPDTSAVTEPAPTYTQSPSFNFTGTDPDPPDGLASGVDHFECSLNGSATWQTCSSGSPIPQTAPEGQNTMDVRAVDKAGNKDASPSSITFIVDLTAPDITIDEPDNKDRFLLHQGPNPIYSCTDPLVGSPAAASGFPPSGALTTSSAPGCVATPINDEDLGPHYFEVTATDRAGNTSTKKVAYTIDPPAYRDLIDEDGPLAYYRLDEPVGSADMLDSSGNDHHGTYQNGIALGRNGATACERRPHPPRACELAAPPENKAAYFPARDGHGYVNGITAPTDAYSMEAWVKPRDGADMMVMGHGGGGQLFISGGKLAFRQVQDTITSNANVPAGVWSHVAATWDGHNTRLYVNGAQVAHSTSANKPPSGTSTFYVGYGEMAPWFHGDMDEAAYYDTALTAHDFDDRYKTGTAFDHPSLEAGNSPFNTEGPFTDPGAPKNNGIYAPTKTPNAAWQCTDPDDLPGDSDIASCDATVDGNPIAPGDPLPDSIGTHTFVVNAVDEGGNVYNHPHTYRVMSFANLFKADNPIAYYRLGDPSGSAMADSSANGHDGEYKNDQDSGPVGISGDGDRARDFFGAGGYGYVNGIAAPRYQATLEAWVKPLGNPDPTSTEFSDSALPGGWSQQNVWNPGGSATVSGGRLTVDGASAGTNATYGSGRTLDFSATFNATPFAHAGFGVDYNNPPWAMFSVKGDGRLYARTNNGVDNLETDLGIAYLGSDHRYRIEWRANEVVYYVDGAVAASHAVSFGATQMRPLASDFNTGGGNLSLDWLRMSPHSARDQSIVGHGGDSDAGEIYIKDGYFRFRHMDTEVISSIPVKPGEWQQVVGTWDGVDIRIYVDGVEAGKTEATKRPSSTNTFYVGYGEMAPWFNGSIDEVAYYETALPTARVFQHFLADPPPSAAGDAGEAGDSRINPPGDPTDPPDDPTDPPDDPVDPPDDPVDPVDPVDPPATAAPMSATLSDVKVGKRVVKAAYTCGKAKACSGKASAVLILGKARFSLGSKSFSAAAGGEGKLRFKLKKKQRKAAKAQGSPDAEITLRSSDGRVLDRG